MSLTVQGFSGATWTADNALERCGSSDYNSSLAHDVRLLRNAPGTPPHVDIFGYLYDIDMDALTKVVEDRSATL